MSLGYPLFIDGKRVDKPIVITHRPPSPSPAMPMRPPMRRPGVPAAKGAMAAIIEAAKAVARPTRRKRAIPTRPTRTKRAIPTRQGAAGAKPIARVFTPEEQARITQALSAISPYVKTQSERQLIMDHMKRLAEGGASVDFIVENIKRYGPRPGTATSGYAGVLGTTPEAAPDAQKSEAAAPTMVTRPVMVMPQRSLTSWMLGAALWGTAGYFVGRWAKAPLVGAGLGAFIGPVGILGLVGVQWARGKVGKRARRARANARKRSKTPVQQMPAYTGRGVAKTVPMKRSGGRQARGETWIEYAQHTAMQIATDQVGTGVVSQKALRAGKWAEKRDKAFRVWYNKVFRPWYMKKARVGEESVPSATQVKPYFDGAYYKRINVMRQSIPVAANPRKKRARPYRRDLGGGAYAVKTSQGWEVVQPGLRTAKMRRPKRNRRRR
jgi:hypothetical protein